RFRLMLTLELAVMLPAAALIYLNFAHVKSIKRDKKVEASIHRDFQYMLATSETHINDKFYDIVTGVRELFPEPGGDAEDNARKLDLVLSQHPRLAHAFLFDADKGTVFRSQPSQMGDKFFHSEHDRLTDTFAGWFGMESKMLCQELHKKAHPIAFYPDKAK